MGSFGISLPVVALNNSFLGAVTRIGKRGITARQVLSTSANGPKFGDPLVIVPTAGGGDTYQSVLDYVTANGAAAFTAALFAGVAVRNMKTNLNYSTFLTIGGVQVGYFAPGEMAEGLEEGSAGVAINNGTPLSQSPLYVRTTYNASIPAGVVGGFEAVQDGTASATANSGNTGNGTMNTPTVGALTAGKYYVYFNTATAFTVTSATGQVIGTGTTGTAFISSYINFTITAGGTAFVRADGFTITATMNTVLLPNVVFRTGVLDSNNIAEITILNRVAA